MEDDLDEQNAALDNRIDPHFARPGHRQEKNCFVVMPYGRNAEEIRWFTGWYRQVIEPAVRAAGLEPILAAAQERPNAINDEIRTHLAYDSMVVVDLGGISSEAEPNPNVMYELGIRHAFNLPHVIMAWAGQRLPFDISNQRVIMERRGLIDIDVNREKLTNFIGEAIQGNYYKPMDAVARVATLAAAERGLGTDSVLGALVEEVRDLRSNLTFRRGSKAPSKSSSEKSQLPTKKGPRTVSRVISDKTERKILRTKFLESGGTTYQWDRVLSSRMEEGFTSNDKLEFLLTLAQKFPAVPNSIQSKDMTLRSLLGSRLARKKIKGEFLASGGTTEQWAKVLKEPIDFSVQHPSKIELVRELARKYAKDGKVIQPEETGNSAAATS